MKFDQNLAAIHGYLCGDGYVVRNPPEQKHKYYHIALRNYEPVLLHDFQRRFQQRFGLKPRIYPNERCIIQNKAIYEYLTKEYVYGSYVWRLPQMRPELLRHWLRAFFDCEAWVECQARQNRAVRLECVNQTGVGAVMKALLALGIKSTPGSHRHLYRLSICGKENLMRFQKNVGFLHPKKSKLLEDALQSYVTLDWYIPQDKEGLLKFVADRGRVRADRNELKLMSVKKQNLVKLKKRLLFFGIRSEMFGPWQSSTASYYVLRIKDGVRRK